jgi:hypothetical protein
MVFEFITHHGEHHHDSQHCEKTQEEKNQQIELLREQVGKAGEDLTITVICTSTILFIGKDQSVAFLFAFGIIITTSYTNGYIY